MPAQPDHSREELPSFLNNTDPMEMDDLPLQVALLTMETAALHRSVCELVTTVNRMTEAPWQATIKVEMRAPAEASQET